MHVNRSDDRKEEKVHFLDTSWRTRTKYTVISHSCSYRASFTGSDRTEIEIKPALVRVVVEDTQLCSTHNISPLFLWSFATCFGHHTWPSLQYADNKYRFLVMHYPKVPISSVPGENIFSGTFLKTQCTVYYLRYSNTSQNNINMAGVRNFFLRSWWYFKKYCTYAREI